MTTGSGLSIAETEQDRAVQNRAIRQLIEGRSNAVGSCTLTANTTTTAVTAVNCGPNSAVFLFPKTANAAAVAASTYISAVAAKSFTVTHPSNANMDKTFGYVCLG